MAGRSEVWNFFDKINSVEAKCRNCSNVIKCKGSSTTGLINHLKRHQIEVNKKSPSKRPDQVITKNIDLSSPKKRCMQPSILGFVQRDSLNKLLSRCAAKDGFSFRSITRSTAINEFIVKRGFEM